MKILAPFCRPFFVLSASSLLHFAPAIAAGPPAVCLWTSIDQRSIEARFLGAGPAAVLIEKNGERFVVPFSQLDPRSVAQARVLARSSARAGASESKSVPDDPGKQNSTASIVPAIQSKPDAVASESIKPSAVMSASMTTSSAPSVTPRPVPVSLMLNGRTAFATTDVPDTVQRAITAGNRLQTKPYKWGGGRAPLEDTGYDCSGSVSYVLIKAGLLREALTSGSFANYGEQGPGKWITIFARPGHVYMTVCGLRLDTGGRGGIGESGPRWSLYARSPAGCSVRHPQGF